jgi:hypothetical protein
MTADFIDADINLTPRNLGLLKSSNYEECRSDLKKTWWLIWDMWLRGEGNIKPNLEDWIWVCVWNEFIWFRGGFL